MSADPLSRRKFIKTLAGGGAVAALTSCDTGKQTPNNATAQATYDPETDPKNLFNVLKRPEFEGVRMKDGSPMNVEALKQKLKDKFVTVSFGWNGCGSYCPRINSSLVAAGGLASNPENIVSIAISVAPRDDGADQSLRDGFVENIRSSGVRHEIVPLFPNNNQQVMSIQEGAMNLIIRRDDPLQHSAMITLYAPGGKEVARTLGLDDSHQFLKTWKNHFDRQTQPAR